LFGILKMKQCSLEMENRWFQSNFDSYRFISHCTLGS